MLGPTLRAFENLYTPIAGSSFITQALRRRCDNTALRAYYGYPLAKGATAFPEKRFYFSNQELITTKVAIHSNLFTDIYSLIGTGSFETGWFTTIMRLPFIFCIWLGFLFGVIGGFLSLKKQLQKSKINWL